MPLHAPLVENESNTLLVNTPEKFGTDQKLVVTNTDMQTIREDRNRPRKKFTKTMKLSFIVLLAFVALAAVVISIFAIVRVQTIHSKEPQANTTQLKVNTNSASK